MEFLPSKPRECNVFIPFVFIQLSLVHLLSCCAGESNVIVSSPTLVVTLAGDDVILPCLLDPAVSAEDETVEWSKENLKPEIVHLYRNRVETKEEKNPHYTNRTSLFLKELKNGNISMRISRVELSDRGKYRCYVPSLKNRVQSSLQLEVGAVSTPIVWINGTNGDAVILQCEAVCWFPEPELHWLDDEGRIIPAEPTRRDSHSGCHTMHSRLTVPKTDTKRFTCRVQQQDINQTRETEIQVSACVNSCTNATVVSVVVSVGLTSAIWAAVIWKRRTKWKPIKDEMKLLKEQSVEVQTLLNESKEASDRESTTIRELQHQLADKDATIKTLSEQLRLTSLGKNRQLDVVGELDPDRDPNSPQVASSLNNDPQSDIQKHNSLRRTTTSNDDDPKPSNGDNPKLRDSTHNLSKDAGPSSSSGFTSPFPRSTSLSRPAASGPKRRRSSSSVSQLSPFKKDHDDAMDKLMSSGLDSDS